MPDPLEREVSYGGIVVRGGDLLVITPAGKPVTTLPKGGASPGESGEAAAMREVREETGVTARVRGPLGDTRYWYSRDGRRIAKVVHFFLADYVAGSTDDHDREVDDARWLPFAEAARALSYPGERALVERARSLLSAER